MVHLKLVIKQSAGIQFPQYNEFTLETKLLKISSDSPEMQKTKLLMF